MKTVIRVEIKMSDDEFDRLEKQGEKIDRWSLDLIEDVIQDALFTELGVIAGITVTKIE